MDVLAWGDLLKETEEWNNTTYITTTPPLDSLCYPTLTLSLSPLQKGPSPYPPPLPLPTHPLFSVPLPFPVGAAAPPLVEFGHLTLLNRLKLRLDIVGIDNDPTFVAPGTPVATPELFNNPEVIGPNTPDVMGFRIPESKPPTRPPPPLLLGAVAFWAWVAVAAADVRLAVPPLLLLLLGKKVKAAEAFQVGRGAEEEVLA